MTASDLLTREELIKHAALHVHGLLDAVEEARYRRSFDALPAHLQDEIILLQASIASDESLLADEEPSPELRQRVIDAVMRAIEDDAERFAPLATIGAAQYNAARSRRGVEQRAQTSSSGRSLMFWRAACFVLLASLLTTLYLFGKVSSESTQIARMALNYDTMRGVDEVIGTRYKDFYNNPNVEHVALRPVVSDFPGTAILHVNEVTGDVFLMAAGLPRDSAYELRLVLDAETEKYDSWALGDASPVLGQLLEGINVAAAMAQSWQIVDKTTGAVVMRT